MTSHYTPLILSLLTIAFVSCSIQRKSKNLERELVTAEVSLNQKSIISRDSTENMESPFSDTLTVIDPEGKRVHLMRTTVDSSGEVIATEELQAAVVTARFSNIAERNGKINISFDIELPEMMVDKRWQIRLRPQLVIMGDTTALEEVHITGDIFRERQLKGYRDYERFLSSIITDSSELLYGEMMEIFMERNFTRNGGNHTYRISPKEVSEYYTKKGATYFNNLKIKSKEQKFRQYVKDPFITYGIRIDSVVKTDNSKIKYSYSQQIETRKGLKKIDLTISGAIFSRGKMLYDIPCTEPLTFYVSSFSTLAEDKERYLTKVIERKSLMNITARIDFEAGKYAIDETMNDNSEELEKIKSHIENILYDREFNIDSLVITASASPEGSYSLNENLSALRGEEIARYLEKHITMYQNEQDSLLQESKGAVVSLNDEPPICEDLHRTVDFKLHIRNIPENWDEFVKRVEKETNISDKEGIISVIDINDPDQRENELKKHPEYEYICKEIYPSLRVVKFDFHLHRKGMVKDTIHTTMLDSTYMKGVQALKDKEYTKAIECLGGYEDINTAIAFISVDYNASAMRVLERVPSTPKKEYLLAILHARMKNEKEAVEHFLRSVAGDSSMFFRGNLDPEIGHLIKKYHLNKD